MHTRSDRPAPEPSLTGRIEHSPEYSRDHVAGAAARREINVAVDRADVDGAIARHVRRARDEDVPVEQMVAALERLLAHGYRTRSTDDDRAAAVQTLVRRAVTRYHRDD